MECTRCKRVLDPNRAMLELTYTGNEDGSFDCEAHEPEESPYCDWFCLVLDAAFMTGCKLEPYNAVEHPLDRVWEDVFYVPDWWDALKSGQFS